MFFHGANGKQLLSYFTSQLHERFPHNSDTWRKRPVLDTILLHILVFFRNRKFRTKLIKATKLQYTGPLVRVWINKCSNFVDLFGKWIHILKAANIKILNKYIKQKQSGKSFSTQALLAWIFRRTYKGLVRHYTYLSMKNRHSGLSPLKNRPEFELTLRNYLCIITHGKKTHTNVDDVRIHIYLPEIAEWKSLNQNIHQGILYGSYLRQKAGTFTSAQL